MLLVERCLQIMEVNEMKELDPVELLRRQYLQCLDPDSLILPKAENLRLPETQDRIYSRMFDERTVTFPPPVRYRFRVLKKIIAALEEAIEDPEEDVGHLRHDQFSYLFSLIIKLPISNVIRRMKS